MNVTNESNPYAHLVSKLEIEGKNYYYFNLLGLNDKRYEKLPFSIRVLLESAIRNCDNFQVTKDDVSKILDWEQNQTNAKGVEVPFKPARVILQDFTGVPAVVDFAAMRDCVKSLGGDPASINPVCPADLVIDHSVQVDFSRTRSREMRETHTAESDIRSNASSCGGVRRPRVAAPPGYHRSRTRPPSPQTPYSPRPMSPVVMPPQSPAFLAYPIPAVQQCPVVGCPLLSPAPPCMLLTPLQDMEDIHAQPQWNAAPPTRDIEDLCWRCRSDAPLRASPFPQCQRPPPAPSRSLQKPSRCPFAEGANAPPLRIPVSSLSCPQDAPGIPLQDSVCPFHQLQSKWSDALEKNQDIEFERNKERFMFLKWGSQAFKNMLIVPPGSGIVHQVNLEYLARVVFSEGELLYPDSLVGTDSHTTMINGIGVLGWGVGGIEAEAVMLGQSISMVLPPVVGYRLTGELSPFATSTDVVLTITKHLRTEGVVGKFVEFFGDGVARLSLADRATVANMCPEYGATAAFFPVDTVALQYLQQTNRSQESIKLIEAYLRQVKMFRDYTDTSQDPVYSQVVSLDLSDVVPSVSGPKRPHDKITVAQMKEDFHECLSNKVGFKGFGIKDDSLSTEVPFSFEGQQYSLRHGSVVIAAITSCTNTSNPSVMLGAGLLAKAAVEAGLSVRPFVKTSLSPGSGVVTHYLQHSGVTPYLTKLGFDIVGYGCMTCIGNSGPLNEAVAEAIDKGELVCCGVLSGNRNFEGRIHPQTRANYLASPLLVIAYAIAGTVDIDFETQPLGHRADGSAIFLHNIWPSRADIQAVERRCVVPAMFKDVYETITTGNKTWNALEAPKDTLYPWTDTSTYIKRPPFFENMTKELPPLSSVESAHVLLHLGDSVTTDHISPAGSIARTSPAAKYLADRGLTPREFNSYGSRRGNDAVMTRGTFANIRLVNKFLGKAAPRTIHIPSREEMSIFDAADRYRAEGRAVIIVAGKEYGSGSSRDWAAKGPYLLGVRAVLAESFERIHRSNLVGMGVIPLQFLPGFDTASVDAKKTFTIRLPEELEPGMNVIVEVSDGSNFEVLLRFDTEVELTYFRHGGILNYMIRKMIAA